MCLCQCVTPRSWCKGLANIQAGVRALSREDELRLQSRVSDPPTPPPPPPHEHHTPTQNHPPQNQPQQETGGGQSTILPTTTTRNQKPETPNSNNTPLITLHYYLSWRSTASVVTEILWLTIRSQEESAGLSQSSQARNRVYFKVFESPFRRREVEEQESFRREGGTTTSAS